MAAEAREEDTDINSLLASIFGYSQAQKEKNNSALSLIIATEDNFFAWIEDKKQLLVISLKDIHQRNGPNHEAVFQKLSCSQTFPFDVKQISLSFSGQFLSLTGEDGVGILEMPRQWGRTSLYVGGKSNIICRSVMLAEDFFRRKFTIKVLQTAWFPGSQSDIHLLMLTSDNCLRCFDVRQADAPISTIKLFNNFNSSRSFSRTNFAAALGEEAVSFSLAPPLPGAKESTFYPIFVTQENGDTWTLWTRLIQNRLLVEQRGPLTMTPQAEDNYGGEFSSTLCLQTSPPVIILATTTGCIHNCIVLESDQEDYDYEQDEASTPKAGSKFYLRNLELFVYETVRLDLAVLKSDQEAESREFEQMNERVKLCEDKSTLHRYFCVSSAGVHMIGLPWAKDLEHFCLPETTESHAEWEIAAPAEISYILCTKPTEKSSPYRILGVSTTSNVEDGTSFLCLLENGELVKRKIGSVDDVEESYCGDIFDDSSANNSLLQFPSPLKRLKAAGSFDEYVKTIIKRDVDTPVIKAPPSNEPPSPEEIYDLLTQAVGILRAEYIQKLTNASQEIQKRCDILKSHKEQQETDLSLILNDHELSDNAEILADKLSTVSENMVALTERLDHVVHAVQSSAPVLSDVERDWQKECVVIQHKVGNLRRCVEGIRSKYENLALSKTPRKQQNRSASIASPAQLNKIKLYMNEQNNKIAELVDRLRVVDLDIQT